MKLARQGRQGRLVRASVLPGSPLPQAALDEMVEVYDASYLLALEILVDVLHLKQDAWQDTVAGRFRHEFGTHLQGHLTRKIDHAVSGIERNANKVAEHLPRILAAKYLVAGAKTIAQFRATNVALIKKVPGIMIERASDVLSANPDLHVSALKSKLLEAAGGSKAKAELWARDQTLKLNAQIVREKHESVGIVEYIWRTVMDARVRGNPANPATKPGRANHWILEGKRFKYSEPPIVDPSNERRENPGGDYECRCFAQPVLPEI